MRVVYGPSTSFNPSLPQPVIDAALDADPESASAEWLSVWRSDLSDFLDRELIAAATDHGVVVRPPHPAITYTAFADPSGGRGDSFTLGVAHSEGNAVILDCLSERRSPFDPSVVVVEIAQRLREHCVTCVTGDRYAAGWTVEGFAKEGIPYQTERARPKRGVRRFPAGAAVAEQLPVGALRIDLSPAATLILAVVPLD